MMRSLAALRLPSDTGHDQVAAEGEPGAPDRFGRHDHRCYAALHVLDAMAVEPPTLHAGRPRVARATEHQGIDVEVPVEHEAPAAPRSAERGDGLKSPRFHLLKLHVVPRISKYPARKRATGVSSGQKLGIRMSSPASSTISRSFSSASTRCSMVVSTRWAPSALLMRIAACRRRQVMVRWCAATEAMSSAARNARALCRH